MAHQQFLKRVNVQINKEAEQLHKVIRNLGVFILKF